jgi:RHS repeat-associated protein
VYDPYGNVTIYDGSWGSRGSSSYDNSLLYCGYYHDNETGLYHVRNRMYHPLLGRWLQRDPQQYVDGFSLYHYVGGRCFYATDPLGLKGFKIGKPLEAIIPLYSTAEYLIIGGGLDLTFETRMWDCCTDTYQFIKKGWKEFQVQGTVHVGVGLGIKKGLLGFEAGAVARALGVEATLSVGQESPDCGKGATRFHQVWHAQIGANPKASITRKPYFKIEAASEIAGGLSFDITYDWPTKRGHMKLTFDGDFQAYVKVSLLYITVWEAKQDDSKKWPLVEKDFTGN